MSHSNYLSVFQSDNVQFKDIEEMNRKLDVSELLCYNTNHTGPFLDIQNDVIVMWDREGEEYTNCVNVWGCFDAKQFNVLAKYLKTGKIVFLYQPEGDMHSYHVITPGNYEVRNPVF